MKPLNKNTLYTIKDFPMDVFIAKYLNIVSDRMEDELTCRGPITHKFVKGLKGTKKPERIKEKCLYFLDALIRECFRFSPDGEGRECSLNADILKKVIGDDYKAIIQTLCEMCLLSFGSYISGEQSRLYIISDNVEFKVVEVVSPKIYNYKKKSKEEIDKFNEYKTYPLVKIIYGEKFLMNYINSLKAIRIEDEDGFNKYQKEMIRDNSLSSVYFRYVYSELLKTKKDIYKIDYYSGANRLYHILTNLKKELKPFLNISFSLDAANSQPLLFVLLILEYYGIKKENYYKLLNYFSSIKEEVYSCHYDSDFLYKYLKINYIDFSFFAKIEPDVLWYMFLSSTGQLWDWLSNASGRERDELKTKMFQEVFYSNKSWVYKNQELAILFRNYFPSVLKLIQRWKMKKMPDDIKTYIEQHNIKPKKNGYLAIAMQQLESKIMGTILTKLYNKRYKAVNIHDCIVIPKTRGKQPSREEVISIMNDVYASYGLVATFK